MTIVNREMYYKYLEQKGWKLRNDVEDIIFNNKRFDLKFRKQIDNLDTRYFQSDPKETILLYYLDTQYIYPRDQSMFYEINTLCRVFRKFDQSKYRYTSCDQDDKSMSNVIIYSGNNHTEKFNQFLLHLPAIEVDQGMIYMDRKKNIETPVLFFGEVGNTTKDKIYKVEKKFPTRVEIPTNFDYFDYNKKIVQKLKNDYNVKQYPQLPKAIQQEELQRQRKQKQERQRKQKQEETFFYSFGYGKSIITPGFFNKLNIKFQNGYIFNGVVRNKDLEDKRFLDGILKLENDEKFSGKIFTDNNNIKYEGKISYKNDDYISGSFDRNFNLIKSTQFFSIKFDNQFYMIQTFYDDKKVPRPVLVFPKQVAQNIYPNMSKKEIISNQMKLTNQLFEKEILSFDVVKKFIEEKVEQLMKKKKQQNHIRDVIDY